MGLLNPRQIVTDAMSLAHANAVLVADLVKRQVRVGAYRPHSLPVQLGLVVLLSITGLEPPSAFAGSRGFSDADDASALSRAPSGNHIPHVVSLSAEYDVFRIDAGRGVAGMPTDHAFGNGAIEQDVGDLSVPPSPAAINQLEAGIALLIGGFLPQPASVIADEVISMESLNKAVTPHNISPVGGFPAYYTGKGGYCGR